MFRQPPKIVPIVVRDRRADHTVPAQTSRSTTIVNAGARSTGRFGYTAADRVANEIDRTAAGSGGQTIGAQIEFGPADKPQRIVTH